MNLSLNALCGLRPIRPLGLWQEGGWRLKVYGIAYERSEPRPGLVTAARKAVFDRLRNTTQDTHYGVGFVGIHDGRTENFVFVSWWADENELHHHVYVSPSERPEQFEYRTPTGLIGCVWDLRVIGFERDAWLRCVLRNPGGASVEDYLAARLSEDA